MKLQLFPLEFRDASESQSLHICTRPAAVLPQLQKPLDLFHSEPEVTSAANEPQGVQVPLVIVR